MMKDWVIENFRKMPDNEALVIYETDGEFLTVEPSFFDTNYFVPITNIPPQYTDLSALPIAQLGWQQIFDQWKERGIV